MNDGWDGGVVSYSAVSLPTLSTGLWVRQRSRRGWHRHGYGGGWNLFGGV